MKFAILAKGLVIKGRLDRKGVDASHSLLLFRPQTRNEIILSSPHSKYQYKFP